MTAAQEVYELFNLLICLLLYSSAAKNDVVGTVFILVNVGEEEIVTASQLGNVPASKYIKVHNDDPRRAL